MEVEFDTRFKHPWSMIVSGPFTKQVLNNQINNLKKSIGSIPNGKTDTKIARESALCRACHPRWTRT